MSALLLFVRANWYCSAKLLKRAIDRQSVGEAIGLEILAAYLSMT